MSELLTFSIRNPSAHSHTHSLNKIKLQGTKWVKINGKLSQIAVYDDEVVGTNPAHRIFRTPYSGAPKPKPATKPAPKPAPKPAKTSPGIF